MSQDLGITTRDEAFMRAALALARRGLGRTAPNPSVAALIVDARQSPPVMISRGRTAAGGRPHAEALAVLKAGEAARGATMYVTLEPCARRSVRDDGCSCTEHILNAGIARVVIGAPDPSPFAAGEGAARLRASGVEVVEGVCAAEATALVAGHRLRVTQNRPFITIKLAQTADGFAATADRKPLAITGEEARAFTHRLRASHDAILTGINTVLADDPRLDVRLPGMAGYSPIRIVLDTEGRMPPDSAIMTSAAPAPVWIATANADAFGMARVRGKAEILLTPRDPGGHLDLTALLAALAARGLTRVMVEAGPMLANAFAAAGLCDELVLLTGPEQAGSGLPAIGPALAGWIDIAAALPEKRGLGLDTLHRYLSR